MSPGNEEEMKESEIPTREKTCLVDFSGTVQRVVLASWLTVLYLSCFFTLNYDAYFSFVKEITEKVVHVDFLFGP
jgi:hypothetical protein